MSYQTYIFDLDGTLLDTLDDLTDSVNYALSFFGRKTYTRETIRTFIGNGLSVLIERALGGEKDTDLHAKVLAKFKEYYRVHNRDKTRAYDGIDALLLELKKQGKKCAIVSNKADDAVKQLSAYFFPETISSAVGENERAGIKRKPCPDSLLRVMEELNADRDTTVYIGDSEVDIQTAKNANLPCVSVCWGFKDEEFLLANGATLIVKEPLEILAL